MWVSSRGMSCDIQALKNSHTAHDADQVKNRVSPLSLSPFETMCVCVSVRRTGCACFKFPIDTYVSASVCAQIEYWTAVGEGRKLRQNRTHNSDNSTPRANEYFCTKCRRRKNQACVRDTVIPHAREQVTFFSESILLN